MRWGAGTRRFGSAENGRRRSTAEMPPRTEISPLGAKLNDKAKGPALMPPRYDRHHRRWHVRCIRATHSRVSAAFPVFSHGRLRS
jgi:hypothetical protein